MKGGVVHGLCIGHRDPISCISCQPGFANAVPCHHKENFGPSATKERLYCMSCKNVAEVNNLHPGQELVNLEHLASLARVTALVAAGSSKVAPPPVLAPGFYIGVRPPTSDGAADKPRCNLCFAVSRSGVPGVNFMDHVGRSCPRKQRGELDSTKCPPSHITVKLSRAAKEGLTPDIADQVLGEIGWSPR